MRLPTLRRSVQNPPTYWLTRFLILRALGLVYFIAFLTIVDQGVPLLGSKGLLPIPAFLDRLEDFSGSRWEGFVDFPSLFWIHFSDETLLALAWAGTLVSLMVLCGYANSIMMVFLWSLYLSFNNVGQDWYGFGWEIQLLETGFLAVFLVPLLDGRPFPKRPPPTAVIWLFRWLTFRIMLGAGLIKIRGDSCWRDLSCLVYHWETQPIPNPLSRFLHFMPEWFQKSGVLFNHFCELVAPWFAFWPPIVRHVSGGFMLAFQLFLIVSGNLSFLNWLTIVAILSCFDDSLLCRVFPGWLGRRVQEAQDRAEVYRPQNWAVAVLVAVVVVLSVDPVRNLMSERQAMNTSFTRLHLVNTYGAFGSVGRERPEIVFEGTLDETLRPETVWLPYEFKCKPGDPNRHPCMITPYHYRLDWLIWFAAMSDAERYPWAVHLVWKLLHSDEGTLSLLDSNPFPDRPPRFVRVRLFRYHFAPLGHPSGAWWTREEVGQWLPPLSVSDPRLRRFLAAHGWGE